MSGARTFAEKVLSAHAGVETRAGEIVVCEPDLILGTDGSTPMAIEVFERMGGRTVSRPERVILSRDHYAPPTAVSTLGFHARMTDFASAHGVELLAVGQGIGFLFALEGDRVRPGDLVVGGDSHTVTCGAASAFATGVGSSDLAGAFLTGRVWLRVPDTVRVTLDGALPTGVDAKDVGLELVRELAPRVGPFSALEFDGPGARALAFEDRSVLANLSAEMGAMAGVFPAPGWSADPGARLVAEIGLDLSTLEPMVARPPDPAGAVPVGQLLGEPVDWVFLGTCTGGRAHDFREALRVLEAGGGLAPEVTLAVVPATDAVRSALVADGTLARFVELGALVGTTGCGPCCGTSGPLPPPGARVLSTANRNYVGRMGDPSVRILLASPATCAAAATAGRIVDPRTVA